MKKFCVFFNPQCGRKKLPKMRKSFLPSFLLLVAQIVELCPFLSQKQKVGETFSKQNFTY